MPQLKKRTFHVQIRCFQKFLNKEKRKKNMERTQNDSRKTHKGKHLTKEERIKIETLLNKGHSIQEIAEFLGRHRRTIEREIARGNVKRLASDLSQKEAYSSDRGQDVHDLNATAKGPQLKLGANYEMATFVSEQILDHRRSPAVVAHMMEKLDMPGRVCAKTLYSYIDQGLIPGVSNETLWEKPKRKKRKPRRIRRMKKSKMRRKSIEKRPQAVEERKEFGHWEIDLIVSGTGQSGAALMTLVERTTRKLIVRKLPDKSQESVLNALKRIERSMGPATFRRTFKTITADNGSEFLDVERLQRSAFSQKTRVEFYYAHPYSSWERGSNENANRMIRRFIRKGRDIGRCTLSLIREVEEWINNYPRKILNYNSAEECFLKAVSA
jgi:IS30 family transposase